MFWNNVKSELDYQGISVKELAAITGLQAQSIYNSISKNSLPTIEAALKISKALKQPLEYLINGVFPTGNDNLQTMEIDLLNNFRKLPDYEKKAIIKLCKELSLNFIQ